MSAGTSEFFCLICLLVCSCTAQEIITAERGQDVILPCKAPEKNIFLPRTGVEWTRPGLDPKYIFLYPGEHFYRIFQHPSYQNRVDLQDEDMKHGNVSVILKTVMKNDTGRYECWVFQRETNDRERWSFKIQTVINLEVVEPGEKDGGDMDGEDKGVDNMDREDKNGRHKDGEDMGVEDMDGEDKDGREMDGGGRDGGDKDGGDMDGGDMDGRNMDGEDKNGREKNGREKDGRDMDGGDIDGEDMDVEDEFKSIIRSVLTVILVALASVSFLIYRSLDDP